MTKVLSCFIVCVGVSFYAQAQVGIGTTSPDTSAILHLKSNNQGLLIPRLTTLEQNNIFNLETDDSGTGLIIYNTDDEEFKVNIGTSSSPNWLGLKTEPNPSVKCSATDFSTDVNTDSSINAPIMSTEEWNDDTDLFHVNAGEHTITITETGRYIITVNISLQSLLTNNVAPEIQIAINDVETGGYASTGYMSGLDGHNTSSLHLTEVVNINELDTISVLIKKTAADGVARLRPEIERSNIYIEKL